MSKAPKGRPGKYAQYDMLLAGLPKRMTKRPRYVNGIGMFKGARGDTAWIKIHLRHGATFKGKTYLPGKSLEIKLGKLSSWPWPQLEAKHTELQGKADRGDPLEEAQSPTFQDWASDWLQRAKQRVRGYETIEVHVRCHLLPYFGQKRLSDITALDINKWVAQQNVTLAQGTVKRQYNTLKAILNNAVKAGMIDGSPCSNADTIKTPAGRQRFLDGEEMLRLLAAAQKIADWLPDFILWAIHSGMRKGEIKALLWADIRTMPDGRSIVQIPTSKSGQPRMVTCTATMKDILERQKSRQAQGEDRVFPVSAMTLRRKWEKARKEAGLEDVTVHDLRRTHSTYSAAAGVDLRTLAGRIGHTDLSMLQKHYAALVGDAETEAAVKIEETFRKLTTNA